MGGGQPVELPAHLRAYFWEYPAEGLNWEQGRDTIVLRLLQSGGMDALEWLRSRLSDDELREFIVRRQGHGLDPRRLRFWGLVLSIPRAEVDRWISAAKTDPWYRRTH
jgi:hypothetical protein